MNKIFELIQKSQNSTFSIRENSIPVPIIPNHPEFFPNELRKYVVNHIREQKKFSFTVGDIDVTLYLSLYTSSSYSSYLERMIEWLSFCYLSREKLCGKTLTVYMYFTPLKKVLPPKEKKFKRHHINSGYSTSCKTHNEIVIYREEEWFKVFIHETFHSFGMDLNHENDIIAERELLRYFHLRPQQTDILLSETYSETWARILNNAFLSFHHTGSYSEFKETFLRLLKQEASFSIHQAKKMLQQQGLTYRDLLKPSNNYKEEQANFCYFVLTSLLLQAPFSFISLCLNMNERWITFNNKNPETLHTFIRFIVSLHDHEKILYKYDHKLLSSSNSMRMVYLY